MGIDFRTSQLQTGKIIVTGSLGNLAVYSINTPGASLNDGTITNAQLNLQLTQKDTFMFVSGAIDSMNSNTKGTSVFGGDVYVSGAINGATTTIRKGLVLTPTVITGNYSVTSSDYIIGISASSNITAILPAAGPNGQSFIFKDVIGNATLYSIQINGNGKLIDGKNIYIMYSNYQSLHLINFGSYWSVI